MVSDKYVMSKSKVKIMRIKINNFGSFLIKVIDWDLLIPIFPS